MCAPRRSLAFRLFTSLFASGSFVSEKILGPRVRFSIRSVANEPSPVLFFRTKKCFCTVASWVSLPSSSVSCPTSTCTSLQWILRTPRKRTRRTRWKTWTASPWKRELKTARFEWQLSLSERMIGSASYYKKMTLGIIFLLVFWTGTRIEQLSAIYWVHIPGSDQKKTSPFKLLPSRVVEYGEIGRWSLAGFRVC